MRPFERADDRSQGIDPRVELADLQIRDRDPGDARGFGELVL